MIIIVEPLYLGQNKVSRLEGWPHVINVYRFSHFKLGGWLEYVCFNSYAIQECYINHEIKQ